MKEITRNETVTTTKEVSYFVANDGKEFQYKSDCEAHEMSLIRDEIESGKHSDHILYCAKLDDVIPFDGAEHMEYYDYRWYKPLDKEGIKLLNEAYSRSREEKFGDELIFRWVCVEDNQLDRDYDSVWITTLDDCLEHAEKIVKGLLGDNFSLKLMY